MSAAAAGLAFGLSLIVAIGAQNAFVLRTGLVGRHVTLVVAICVASDVSLIVAGVAGAGAVLDAAPSVATVIRIGGALFLFATAALAVRRALSPTGLHAGGEAGASRRATAGTVLALTWLNPHVYLDTIVLLGSVAHSHAPHQWWFAAGAAVGSTVWFNALGHGARLLRPLFERPSAWRTLDCIIAAVMTAIGISLL